MGNVRALLDAWVATGRLPPLNSAARAIGCAPGALDHLHRPCQEDLRLIYRLGARFQLDVLPLIRTLTEPGLAFAVHVSGECWIPDTPLHVVSLEDLLALSGSHLPATQRLACVQNLHVLFSPLVTAAMAEYARRRQLPEDLYRASQVNVVRQQLRRDMTFATEQGAQRGVTPQAYVAARREIDALLPLPLRTF